MFIHLVVIGWLYVTVMMAVAEATGSTGTLLGAIFTFVLYGLLPVALVVYLLRTPTRRRARQAQEAQEMQAAQAAAARAATGQPGPDSPAATTPAPAGPASGPPDQSGEAAAARPVAPVRKEP